MDDATAGRSEGRSRIVDAATELLSEQGPAALTTRRVAEAAGVQAPAIYRLFGDKDGLMDAVAEAVMTRYVSSKAEVLEAATAEDVDPLEDLHAGWQTQIEFGVAHPALFRLLSDPARAQQSPAARSGRRVLEARVHRVALTGRLRVGEEQAVRMIEAAGIGTIHTLLSLAPQHREASFGDSMYGAVLQQIVLDLPRAADEGSAATAVALRALAPGLNVLTDAERRLLVDWLDRVISAGADRVPPS